MHQKYTYTLPNKPLVWSPGAGYVYVLWSALGVFKIGMTRNPRDRIKGYETSLPFDVELIHLIPSGDQFAAEAHLHNIFEARRFKGEWFNLTTEDIAFIKTLESL